MRKPTAVLSDFWRDDRGMGTIELVLALPIFIVVYVGATYYADLSMMQNKVSRAAFAMANTASMDSSITDDDMAAILTAARAMVAPVAQTTSLVLSSVRDNGGTFQVLWSDTLGGSAHAQNSSYTFPSDAQASFGSVTEKDVLVGEVRVTYTSGLAAIWNSLPFMPYDLPATSTLTDTVFALPLSTSGVSTARVPNP